MSAPPSTPSARATRRTPPDAAVPPGHPARVRRPRHRVRRRRRGGRSGRSRAAVLTGCHRRRPGRPLHAARRHLALHHDDADATTRRSRRAPGRSRSTTSSASLPGRCPRLPGSTATTTTGSCASPAAPAHRDRRLFLIGYSRQRHSSCPRTCMRPSRGSALGAAVRQDRLHRAASSSSLLAHRVPDLLPALHPDAAAAPVGVRDAARSASSSPCRRALRRTSTAERHRVPHHPQLVNWAATRTASRSCCSSASRSSLPALTSTAPWAEGRRGCRHAAAERPIVLLSASRSGFMGLLPLGCWSCSACSAAGPSARGKIASLAVAARGRRSASSPTSPSSPPRMQERILNLNPFAAAGGGRASTEFRYATIQHSFDIIADHPLIGVGLGELPLGAQATCTARFKPPHNSYVWAPAEGGIPTRILYLTLFGFLYDPRPEAAAEVRRTTRLPHLPDFLNLYLPAVLLLLDLRRRVARGARVPHDLDRHRPLALGRGRGAPRPRPPRRGRRHARRASCGGAQLYQPGGPRSA